MSKVKEILKERGNTHGSYKHIVDARARILQELKDLYKSRYPDEELPTTLTVMWCDIALKLVRSAANPSHQDNWDDLAGYANIIQEYMEEANGFIDE